MDAEETAVLQGLLQSSQSSRSALETSNMDISGSDSEGSAVDSRRATLGLGEMKAMLIHELDRYDRRSSVSQRVSQRASLTETDVLSSQPLLDLLKQNPIPAADSTAPTPSIEPMNESESTIDLQQYAAQLREEVSRPSTASLPSARESITADLQSVAREVLSMAALDQNAVAQHTDALLERMSGQPSTAAVAAMDDTITEDLRRLSQLLVAQPEEKPRFSPLVARSGTKQVIHSVKSSQKYGQSAVEEVRVINSMPARPLFQDKEEPEEEEEEKEEEKKEEEEEKENPSPLENSLNLDAYFLPKSFRSILDDSTPQAESIDYDTPDTSGKTAVNRLPSVDSLPSDIQENSIQMEESSLGDWNENGQESVEKVEDSLEGIIDKKQTENTENKPEKQPMNETPMNETPMNETPMNETPMNETPIHDTPIHDTPSIDEERRLNIRSRLASIDFFREKASLQFVRRCQQILDTKSEVQQLCALFKQIREVKRQQNELESAWKEAEQGWKEAEQSFARELQKEKPVAEERSTLKEKKEAEEDEEEEATLKKEMRLLEEDMGLVFTLQSNQSYSILLRRNRLLVAAITVRFVGGGKVALKVILKTSCSKLARKRIEARLPVKQEKEVNCNDMRESICRCIWIVYHSF